MRFDEVLKIVLGFEGGYVNDPNDKGGETNLGITAGTLARAHKAGLVGHSDVKKLTRAEAAKIYEAFYWKPSRCDLLPKPLDLLVFDAAVNHGVGGAGKLLQRALNTMGANLVVDGAIGPKTLGALTVLLEEGKGTVVKGLCGCFMMHRAVYFTDIATNNPTQKKFLFGWLRLRVAALARKAGIVE